MPLSLDQQAFETESLEKGIWSRCDKLRAHQSEDRSLEDRYLTKAQIVGWFYSKQNAFFPRETRMLADGVMPKEVPELKELNQDITRCLVMRRMEYDGVKLAGHFYGRTGVSSEYAKVHALATEFSSTEAFVQALGDFPYRMPIGLFIARFNDGKLSANEIHLLEMALTAPEIQGMADPHPVWVQINAGQAWMLDKETKARLGDGSTLELMGLEFTLAQPIDHHTLQPRATVRYRAEGVRGKFTRPCTERDPDVRACVVESDLYLDRRMKSLTGEEVAGALCAMPSGITGVVVKYQVAVKYHLKTQTLTVCTATSACCNPDDSPACVEACVTAVALRRSQN